MIFGKFDDDDKAVIRQAVIKSKRTYDTADRNIDSLSRDELVAEHGKALSWCSDVLDKLPDDEAARRAVDVVLARADELGALIKGGRDASPRGLTGGSIIRPANEWRDRQGNVIPVYAKGEKMSTGGDIGYSLADAVRAIVVGPKSDRERRALTEGVLSQGGYLVPVPLSNSFIDLLRNHTALTQAGAQVVPMTSATLDIAKLASDPSCVWHSENETQTISDPTFTRIRLTARTLMCLVRLSRELLSDSPVMETQLPLVIARAMGLTLDTACFVGAASGASPSLGPTGILNTASIPTYNSTGKSCTWDTLLALTNVTNAANAKAPGDPGYSFVMNSTQRNHLASLKDSQLRYLDPPSYIRTVPIFTTNGIAQTFGSGTSPPLYSYVFAGDFNDAYLGIREELQIRVLNERYADSNTVGIVATLRADLQIARLGSFCIGTNIGH